MSSIKPMDLAFFLLENTSRQMHMTAYQLLKVPARQKNSFIQKLVKTFRNSEVAPPFNKKLKWLGKNVGIRMAHECIVSNLILNRRLEHPRRAVFQNISDVWNCYIK